VEYVEQCNQCGHRVISYNSCRDRHCPKCQGAARAKWLTEREAEVLPVPYFHVIFTLPQKIGGLAMQNAGGSRSVARPAGDSIPIDSVPAQFNAFYPPCSGPGLREPCGLCWPEHSG
jgi:hypothetical protein